MSGVEALQPRSSLELGHFHRDYRPALMAFFMRRVRNHAEAEDLTQEVFIRIAGSTRPTVRSAEAYIFETAANLLRDRARRAMVRNDYAATQMQLEGAGVEILDPHRVAAGRDALSRISTALDAMPERTRQMFLLFRYEQLDQRSIADSFGISVSAVEKHVQRAMTKLIQATGDAE